MSTSSTESMSFRVRPATPADLEFIVSTERLAGYEHLVASWSPDEHRLAMSRADTRYLVADSMAGTLAGFAICDGLDNRHEGVKLKRIAVAVPGVGAGRTLIHSAMDYAFAGLGAPRFWLDVFSHNVRARRLYLSVGMREEGVLRSSYELADGKRADRVVMAMLRADWPPR